MGTRRLRAPLQGALESDQNVRRRGRRRRLPQHVDASRAAFATAETSRLQLSSRVSFSAYVAPNEAVRAYTVRVTLPKAHGLRFCVLLTVLRTRTLSGYERAGSTNLPRPKRNLTSYFKLTPFR